MIKLTISVSGGSIKWKSVQDAEVISKIFTLSPTEALMQEKPVPAGSVEMLKTYLERKGLKVELEYKDVISQAKAIHWKHQLTKGPRRQTDAEVDEFIANIGINLRPVQDRALRKLLNSSFALNASICGAGKTLVTLLFALYFYKKYGSVLMVVAAPASCMHEYRNELAQHRGHFEDLTMSEVYGGSVNDAIAKLQESHANVVLVSIDSLEKLAPSLQEKFSSFDGVSIMAVEEGHYVKQPTSSRSRGAQLVAPLASRVLVNTATPLPMGAADLRGILSLVGIPQPVDAYANGIPQGDLQILKGAAYICDEQDIPYGPMVSEHLNYGDLEELAAKMRTVVMSEVDEGHKVVIFCSTNRGLLRAWNSLAGVPKAVLSGSFYSEDTRSEGLSSGRNHVAQREAIKRFNFDDSCKVLIANYRVGSTGVNLQHSKARVAFFFEISNNGADFFQARYRIRRPFIFPEKGFRYYFARSQDARARKREDRQFAKLANQAALLQEVRRETRNV